MKKFESLILILIVLLSIGLRVYTISPATRSIHANNITNPIADWHSWRQADTAAVTRNFDKQGLFPMFPMFDDLSDVPSGLENPHGYRMVEFPLYNLSHYTVFKSIGQYLPSHPAGNSYAQLDTAGRLTTIIASTLSLIFLYFIVRKISNRNLALLTGFVFTVLPFNIYYSRVILPDPMMVTASLGAILFFILWLEKTSKEKNKQTPNTKYSILNTGLLAVSALFAASALLLKPTSIFILSLIPLLALIKYKTQIVKQPLLYIYALIAVAPFLIWRQWILQFPEGIPAYTWLLNGDNIRLRPAWFRWLFYERGNLILGGFGSIFLILGFITKAQNNKNLPENIIYPFWYLSGLAYLVIFATGNVRHDYYQIPLIPIICILVAKGIHSLWTNQQFNKWLSIPSSLLLLFLAIFIGWYNVRGYYQINNPNIIVAGAAADRLLPPDAKLVAPYQGDTAFLYQTNRQGWPLITKYPVTEMTKLGATHYISVNYDDVTKELMQTHPILEQNEQYIIIRLIPETSNPNT